MKILVCPKCKDNLIVYYGCCNCGSQQVVQDQLIHHYKCAYVGKQEEFGVPPVCPKCRRNLTPGADFEHLKGPYICNDCHWHDMEREFVAKCTKCEFVFPLHQAVENE